MQRCLFVLPYCLRLQEDLACVAEFKKKDDARASELMIQTQKASVEVTEAKKRLKEEETAALAPARTESAAARVARVCSCK